MFDCVFLCCLSSFGATFCFSSCCLDQNWLGNQYEPVCQRVRPASIEAKLIQLAIKLIQLVRRWNVCSTSHLKHLQQGVLADLQPLKWLFLLHHSLTQSLQVSKLCAGHSSVEGHRLRSTLKASPVPSHLIPSSGR